MSRQHLSVKGKENVTSTTENKTNNTKLDDGDGDYLNFRNPINFTVLYLLLAIFRLVNAFIVRTQFDPDEYWQTLEPAYCAVLSQSSEECALTWEWTRYDELNGIPSKFPIWNLLSMAMHGPIRSYVAVLPTIMLYKLLKIFHTSMNIISDELMTYLVRKGPALLNAVLFAAPTDLAVYSIAQQVFHNESMARFALLASVTSWFNGYALIRTYANSIECALCTISFSFLGTDLFDEPKNYMTPLSLFAMFLGGISVAIRFSAVAFWVPVGLVVCFRKSNSKIKQLLLCLITALFGIIFSCVIDNCIYPFEFKVIPFLGSFHFNVILGTF